MGGKFIRGALVEFMPTFLIPLPNIIIFQFNPETMTHAWTQPESVPVSQAAGGNSNPLAVRGVPGESFSFTLVMDTVDMIADGSPIAEGIATVSGIYTRLAALEMLQYPVPAAQCTGWRSQRRGIGCRRRRGRRSAGTNRAGNAGAHGSVCLGTRPHRAGSGY